MKNLSVNRCEGRAVRKDPRKRSIKAAEERERAIENGDVPDSSPSHKPSYVTKSPASPNRPCASHSGKR